MLTHLMQSHHSRTPGDVVAVAAEDVEEQRMARRSVCWLRSKSTFGAGAARIDSGSNLEIKKIKARQTQPVAADLGGGLSDEGGCCAFPDEDDAEETFPNPELDDCSRVLTTSRGHVMTAPVVPATLE